LGNVKLKQPLSNPERVLKYISSSSGLKAQSFGSGKIKISQSIDNKHFVFQSSTVVEVLDRSDADGKFFLQLNFENGSKVLITDSLVGFKPVETFGLDMGRLPKVVTTPDLQSVLEAIEDAMSSENSEHEVEILKKVFQAILYGAEKVGFELEFEKKWLSRLSVAKLKACA
jgi:hypothetical protein